jgi:hypothetical protein
MVKVLWIFVRFEVFTAVTMKNCVLCRVAPVGTDVSEEPSASNLRLTNVAKNFLRSLRWLLVTANVRSSPILVILIMEALGSSETFGSYKSHTA